MGYGDWEPFIGTDLTTPAIPDYNANYFAFAFTRSDEAKYVGLRLKGQFGYARYMSFNIYRAHRSPSYGALTDTQMLPAPGSVNPFLPGADPNAGEPVVCRRRAARRLREGPAGEHARVRPAPDAAPSS